MKVFFGFEEFPIIYSHEKLGKIKSLLERGEMGEVNEMLGAPYRIKGTMGHRIQLTQINNQFHSSLTIDQGSTLLPGPGVYAVTIRHKGSVYIGKVNIGVAPDCKQIEFLIKDFSESMIEKEVEITFNGAGPITRDASFRQTKVEITEHS